MFRDGGQSMKIQAYLANSGCSALFSANSRPSCCNRLTSAAVRSPLEGSRSNSTASGCRMVSSIPRSPSMTSQAETCRRCGSMPQPVDAFPWGSRSTSSTGYFMLENAAARFTQVVVFPTPPFWFATAMILANMDSCLFCCSLRVSYNEGHNDEVTVLLQSRHAEFFHRIDANIVRQPPEFHVRVASLHRE